VSGRVPRPRIYNAFGLLRISGLGCSHFARHYFGNRYCFLFLRLLRCLSSPRSPLPPMYSEAGVPALPGMGCPIRRSPDLSLFGGSPKLIVAYNVLHRLLAPRHPPSALCSLTTNKYPLQTDCQRTRCAFALSQELKAETSKTGL
jgi:hypothetical protein